MKPNFALNLSHDGISLLHRAKAGWMPVGDVQLDAPDLNTQLSILRQTAADLDQSGLACKLIIPNSQILYTELTVTAADNGSRLDQIRQGLIGLTPYEVEDLVFDWRAIGNQVQVAVVARDTLKEAESFAAEFRFNPVSFIGVPSQDVFEGEPFFGPCSGAPAILGTDVSVDPDTEAMTIVAARKTKIVRTEITEAAADIPTDPPPVDSANADTSNPSTNKPKKAKRGKNADITVSTTAATIPDAGAPLEPPAQTDAAAPEPTAPALSFASRRAAAGGRNASQSPPADETSRAQISRYSALDLDDVPEMPAWRNAESETSQAMPITSPQIAGMEDAPPPVSRLEKIKNAASSTPRNGNRKAAIAASSQEAKAMTVFGAREKTVVRGKPKYLGLALTLLLLLALGVAALWSSLFLGSPNEGTGSGQVAGITQGIPSGSTPENVASGNTTETAQIEASPSLASTSPEVVNPATPSETVSLGVAEAPLSNAIESAVTTALSAAPSPESPLPSTESAAPLTPPTSESPETEGAEPELEIALLQDPVNSAVTASPPPDRITQAPPTQAEAERRYATSGIWQLDPNPLADPDGTDRLESLLFASIDPNLIEQTPGRFSGVAPDSRPVSLTPPAPLGITFDLNDRGLVVATPEGATSPDGVVIYLGLPPQIPGVRPGTVLPESSVIAPAPELTETASLGVAPETSTQPSTETGTESATETAPENPSGSEVETPLTQTEEVAEPSTETLPPLTPELEILRQFRPAARPSSFDETFQQAPDGEGFTLEQLASIRPTIRPPSIQEEVAADAPQLPETETENTETDVETNNEFALASSTIPRGRPAAVERAAAVFLEKRRESVAANPPPKPEVEVAAVVVPNVPARASVARAATERNAINLKKVNLIGVYGSSADRRALVRLKSGRYVKVEVGDRVDGGRVAAISSTELRYVKSGKNITLKLPKG